MVSPLIAVAGNSAYFVPLIVCVRSIAEQAPGMSIRVLDCGLTFGERELLQRTVKDSGDLQFVTIVERRLSSLPAPACGSWATYARLYVGDVLSDATDVLYLDADTLVRGNISALLNEDLRGLPIAAAREMYTPTFGSENGIAEWNRLGLDPATLYFNAGVLLINVPVWNSLNIRAQAFAYLETPGRSTRLFDQEALNYAINGRWLELDPVWNVTRFWYRSERRKGGFERILEEARILHFLAESKPWIPGAPLPSDLAQSFFECLDRTELSGWRPEVG